MNSVKLAEACRPVLDDEDRAELAALDFKIALGHAFTLLYERGVEDPAGFLAKRGVLEPDRWEEDGPAI